MDFINEIDNGLIKEYNANEVKVKVYFKPSDLMISQELGGNTVSAESTLNALKKKYQQYYYFNIELSMDKTETGSDIENKKKLQHITFGMQNNVILITSNNDTIVPTDYIAPPAYGNTGNTSFLYAFENKKIIESNPEIIQMVFKNSLNNNEKMEFAFEFAKIKKIPSLKIELSKN